MKVLFESKRALRNVRLELRKKGESKRGTHSVSKAYCSDYPLDCVDGGCYGDKHEPIPHKQVDLLVEQIYAEHTLYCVLDIGAWNETKLNY